MDGNDGVDFAYIPVQVAMDGVSVDRFSVTGGNALKISANLDRLGIDDDGVFA